MGYSLHMLHFAWCFALSAAESLWSTGSQTILWGSCCNQLKKWTASISFLSFPAFSKQLRTLGSMFDPPNAATSPNCLGTWMQSCNNKPSFRWSTNLFGSAISRNRSGISVTRTLYTRFSKRDITREWNNTHIDIFLPNDPCTTGPNQLWRKARESDRSVDWNTTTIIY